MEKEWIKSPYSNGTGGSNCVEVKSDKPHCVHIRNSRRPETELCFTRDEWNAFCAGMTAGTFDNV